MKSKKYEPSYIALRDYITRICHDRVLSHQPIKEQLEPYYSTNNKKILSVEVQQIKSVLFRNMIVILKCFILVNQSVSYKN